ncbi:Uncharacterized protein FWK35_00018435, partial [Aphis craccivora]
FYLPTHYLNKTDNISHSNTFIIYIKIIYYLIIINNFQYFCSITTSYTYCAKKYRLRILKKVGKWVPLCCTLGAVWITISYYRRVKFESNDNYHCIPKTILNGDDLSA